MPATTITAQVAPDKYSTTGTAVTMNASDPVNDNDVLATHDQLWIVQNTAGVAGAITIPSTADGRTGRTGDVDEQVLAAGEIRVFRTQPNGWADSNGKINYIGFAATLKVAVINL